MRSKLFYTSAVIVAMTLTACGPNGAEPMMNSEALPLAAGDATSIAPAPAVEALPAAPATRVVYVSQPDDSYQYVDDAYAISDALGDAPPDYGFDYEGSHPWAWRTADNALRLYEAASDGDRYYYYRPGQSDPYLVRDAGYSYAYSGGNLVSVYDDRGRALDRAQAERRAEYAGRYLARARALEAAAARDHRQQVIAANWSARQPQIRRDNDRWAEERRQSQSWQAYHDRQEAQENAQKRAQLQAERDRRQRESVAFNHWRDGGYKGQAPRVQVAEKTSPRRDWQFWKRQDDQREHAQTQADQHRQETREQQARNDREHHDRQAQARADQDRRQVAPRAADRKSQMARQDEAREHDAQQARQDQVKAQQLAQKKEQAARQAEVKKQLAAREATAKKQQAAREAQQKQQAVQQANAERQKANEKAREEARAHPNNRQRPEDRRPEDKRTGN